MRFLVSLSLLIAIAASKPTDQTVAVHQDSIGNYKLDVNVNGITRSEQGNADGTVSGSYSFVDAEGVLQTVQYTAGPEGFRTTGTHLPVAPIDLNIPVRETEDVLRARAEHFAALRAASHGNL